MKPELGFDSSKLKGSKTMETYEGYLGKIAKSLSGQHAYMSFDSVKVVEAIKRQAEKLTCHSFGAVTSRINNELAEKLIQITPGEHGDTLTASSQCNHALAMLNDGRILTIAVSPNGLAGTYPVWLDAEGVKLTLPDGIEEIRKESPCS